MEPTGSSNTPLSCLYNNIALRIFFCPISLYPSLILIKVSKQHFKSNQSVPLLLPEITWKWELYIGLFRGLTHLVKEGNSSSPA